MKIIRKSYTVRMFVLFLNYSNQYLLHFTYSRDTFRPPSVSTYNVKSLLLVVFKLLKFYKDAKTG